MVVATRPRTVNERRGEQLAGSAAWYERATQVFPSGVTHETRFFQPFPIYIDRAEGSRKWDVDGNEYVDYIGGHGALLLGHGHPALTAAATEQLQRGTHYGASHELEVRWAELVTEIVPSAERVRFHSSGTEATMMAMRLARGFTGKDVIIKMQGHFHGWHDYAALQMAPPYDEPVSVGIPQAVQESVVGVPAGDIAALRAVLDARDDVAGVILLCNGMSTEYLQQVRNLTRERDVILIFDEVVTGFRWAPGGCQEYHGVVPDLTTLAKILAGGLPGGAVCGRRDIMELFKHWPDDPHRNRHGRIAHQGTFNANPLAAAAGIACLEIVRDPAIQRRAAATAGQIRDGINDVLLRHSVGGEAGANGSAAVASTDASMVSISVSTAEAARIAAAMQLYGVDTGGRTGMIVSAVHDERDVGQTVTAFERALELIQDEGAL